MAGQVSISQFLRNKKILITGSTGLVGKCLVEKLVRDAPDLGKLYLLVRAKQGESSVERSRKYFNSMAFDRVRNRNPEELVQFLAGDMMIPECGLNPQDKELITDVDIVFHSAADVSFTRQIQKMVAVNVGGTKNVLDLALSMKNIQSFVSISTAFSTPHEFPLEERIYPTNLEPLEAIELFSNLPPEWSEKLSKSAIGPGRTPYQYSKQLAENLVQSYRDRLPVCLVRPGTVLAAIKEPIPGWNETNTAISIHSQNMFTSAYHTSLIRAKYQFAVTPIDTLVNTTIAAAWRQSTTSSEDFLVYNCVAPPGHGLTNQELLTWAVESIRKDPPPGQKYLPTGSSTQYYSVYLTKQVLFRFIPSLVYNTVVHLNPKRSVKELLVWNIKNRIMGGLFLAKEWKFATNNMRELNELMTPEDRERFPIDFTQVDWKGFIQMFVQGLFKFGPPLKEENKSSHMMK